MTPDWLNSVTHKDWLFDGHEIRGEVMIERFNNLDWSGAWMDMGPSVAGNPGPYWHVPLPSEETTHRLYPKVLKSKWLLVVRQAIREAEAAARREEREAWRKWLAETRVAVAGQTFDPDSMIICGGKPTPKDTAQFGYAAALLAWEAAIRARKEG
jgi:hypothetical protein